MAILIAVLVTFSMIASMILIPSVNAHTPPWRITTWAYINVEPNPVGVGQSVYLVFWIDKNSPTASGTYGDHTGNMTVQVTLPDGTVQTLGPFQGSANSAYSTYYEPTVVGNYTFVYKFLGWELTGANPSPVSGTSNPQYVNDTLAPSTSQAVTLVVQKQPVSYPPTNPLPTAYWTRPIEASGNLGWYQISGNWLGFGQPEGTTGGYSNANNFNPYTTAPGTAHILWTKPTMFGGVIGGEFGGTESGSSYMTTTPLAPQWAPVIINGILYYTNYPGAHSDPMGWSAINLQTGQTEWIQSSPTTLNSPFNTELLRNGQTISVTTVNQFGGMAYLWGVSSDGTTYSMYDAMTGNFILNITNVPFAPYGPLIESVNGGVGSITEDAHGDLSVYYVDATNPNAPMLDLWNSTLAILGGPANAVGVTHWRPELGANIPWSEGIQWSVPLATNISGVDFNSEYPLAIACVDSGVVLMHSLAYDAFLSTWNPGWEIQAGYDANTGRLLWIANRTGSPFAQDQLANGYTAGSGLYSEVDFPTGGWTVYNIATGQKLWGPITSPAWSPWDVETGCQSCIAYGELITMGLGGDITAFNVTNGNVLWTWTTPNSGLETIFGHYPLWVGFPDYAVAGGEILVGSGHEYNPPLYQDSQLWAVNATTGKTVWSILGFDVQTAPAVSDGIVVDFNSYDGQIYAYGKGPSAITVTAPQVGVTTSTPITITGTVMDTSAGSQQQAVSANFPHGLPCVSDASMSQFMEAVYEQQPMPTNLTGVPVTIAVTDSNHNCYDIGTAISSPTTGFYSLTWTPIIPGNFTVTASFAGTQSYYGSTAQTAFYASSPGPTAAPAASPPTGLASTGTVELGIAIVVIVIVIIGVAILAVMLRRRP